MNWYKKFLWNRVLLFVSACILIGVGEIYGPKVPEKYRPIMKEITKEAAIEAARSLIEHVRII
jgi:hypothetical protein